MGVDICGMNPTSERGDLFKYSWAGWCPIVDYVRDVAPSIAAKCKHWNSNDGDGLMAADAAALANLLQVEIDSGRAELRARTQEQMFPSEGIVIRAGEPFPERLPEFPLNIEHLRKFVTFLRASGAFAIW